MKVIETEKTLTFSTRGKVFVMKKIGQLAKRIKESIRLGNDQAAIDYMNLETGLPVFSCGDLTLKEGVITWKGKKVSSVICDEIIKYYYSGEDYKPLFYFLHKYFQNPDQNNTDNLDVYIQQYGLQITPNGNFIAYKGVREDYTDWYTGTIRNKVGDNPKVPRDQINPCRQVCISYGLHLGTFFFSKTQYTGHDNEGHLMKCECNPKDVVVVPVDVSQQKIKTCEYKVIAEVDINGEEIKQKVHKKKAAPAPETKDKTLGDKFVSYVLSRQNDGNLATVKSVQSRFKNEKLSKQDILNLAEENKIQVLGNGSSKQIQFKKGK